jgi:hypothetical protein
MTTPTPVLAPVHFEAPPVNPTAFGLYASTVWTEIGSDEPSRHLTGVEVRPGGNYGGENASGIWGAPWCSVPPFGGDRKEGQRPGGLDPFEPMTVWAYDECDLTEPSRAEVQQRAMHIMRLEEQVVVEREFAERLKLDAADLGAPQTAVSFKLAVGYLEGAMARTNTLGFFHAGAQWASQELGLVVKSGTRWTSPLGHVWVFGGGYVEGLENTIVATSQPFGWRDQVQLRTAIDERHNVFAAIAERTVLVGYETVIAAVEITP